MAARSAQGINRTTLGKSLAVLAAMVALPTHGLRAQNSGGALTSADVLAASSATEWRTLDPEQTIYMELPGGLVVIELAPQFAPRHVDNIRALVSEGFFDGGSVVRSQDNYVAQWTGGAPTDGSDVATLVSTPLRAEFEVQVDTRPFAALPDPDTYAPETGYVDGFPAAYDPALETMWMAHCYGTVGVARGNDPDSGNGSQLYMVTGHSPRHLDRNISMVGRVVLGAEHLTTLPRGVGGLAFYESESDQVPITSMRVGTDVPENERVEMMLLRTDSDSFRAYMMTRRTRSEAFFVNPTGRIEVCNVGVPTRMVR